MFNYGNFRPYDNPLRQNRLQPFAGMGSPKPMMSTPLQAPQGTAPLGLTQAPPTQSSAPQANYNAIAQQMASGRIGIGRAPTQRMSY